MKIELLSSGVLGDLDRKSESKRMQKMMVKNGKKKEEEVKE